MHNVELNNHAPGARMHNHVELNAPSNGPYNHVELKGPLEGAPSNAPMNAAELPFKVNPQFLSSLNKVSCPKRGGRVSGGGRGVPDRYARAPAYLVFQEGAAAGEATGLGVGDQGKRWGKMLRKFDSGPVLSDFDVFLRYRDFRLR